MVGWNLEQQGYKDVYIFVCVCIFPRGTTQMRVGMAKMKSSTGETEKVTTIQIDRTRGLFA